MKSLRYSMRTYVRLSINLFTRFKSKINIQINVREQIVNTQLVKIQSAYIAYIYNTSIAIYPLHFYILPSVKNKYIHSMVYTLLQTFSSIIQKYVPSDSLFGKGRLSLFLVVPFRIPQQYIHKYTLNFLL